MRAPLVRAAGPVADAMAHATRFWSKVDRSGPTPADSSLGPCWLWTAARNRRRGGVLSYGMFTVLRRRILAHRFAFEIETGTSPPVVCHRCDNVACVRPSHLIAGTQADNLADMRAKGRAHFNRFPKGTRHPNAKITPEVAERARELRRAGVSLAKIGAEVGLHPSTVHDVVRGVTWRAS